MTIKAYNKCLDQLYGHINVVVTDEQEKVRLYNTDVKTLVKDFGRVFDATVEEFVEANSLLEALYSKLSLDDRDKIPDDVELVSGMIPLYVKAEEVA